VALTRFLVTFSHTVYPLCALAKLCERFSIECFGVAARFFYDIFKRPVRNDIFLEIFKQYCENECLLFLQSRAAPYSLKDPIGHFTTFNLLSIRFDLQLL